MVTAALHVRGITIPWQFVVWQAKRWVGKDYRKPTEMAADLIREFQPPHGVKVRALFDAFYLCPTVTKACASRVFLWYSVSMKNRRLTHTGRGKSGLLKQLGPGILKHGGQKVRLQCDRGWRAMRIAAVDGQLKSIGAVRIVFSKRPRDPWRNLLAIATNDLRHNSRRIIEIYARRWSIEVLFKELRGLKLRQSDASPERNPPASGPRRPGPPHAGTFSSKAQNGFRSRAARNDSTTSVTPSVTIKSRPSPAGSATTPHQKPTPTSTPRSVNTLLDSNEQVPAVAEQVWHRFDDDNLLPDGKNMTSLLGKIP